MGISSLYYQYYPIVIGSLSLCIYIHTISMRTHTHIYRLCYRYNGASYGIIMPTVDNENHINANLTMSTTNDGNDLLVDSNICIYTDKLTLLLIYIYSGYSGVLQLVYNGIRYTIVVLSGTQTQMQRHGTSPI